MLFFSISICFYCRVYGAPVIQHHLFLVYTLIGSSWFGLVGGAGCWFEEKTAKLYYSFCLYLV